MRSGTAELGVWLPEKRNISEDYKRYIGEPPERIVRVWLIAGSRWQRFKGDMSVKNVKLASPRGITDVN